MPSRTDTPRACRIVCTLGPASCDSDTLERMIAAGMNAARLNFSHGTRETHRSTLACLREACRKTGREVAVLQDLQGHKVRTGCPEDGDQKVPLRLGQRVFLGHGDRITSERIGIDYEGIARHSRPGNHVYLDDGLIELEVVDVQGADLVCEVRMEGDLKARKGVILPEVDLDFPLLDEKDLGDARFGMELDVDMVAMSFVRSAEEVRAMRERLGSWGQESAYIVAKIEERRGIDNLEGILDAADAVLIARGDMGVSLPRELVPGIQRQIIRRANTRGVPVITATQMLESMIEHTRPTRAEVSDVYHAVRAGTDAVMLSAETATGKHPVLAVEEMDRIARAAARDEESTAPRDPIEGREGLHDRVAEATAVLALRTEARAVLSFSLTGATLRALSAARCPVPVYGVVDDPKVLRRLLLFRGLSLRVRPRAQSLEEIVDPTLEELVREGQIASGDRIVVVAGRGEPGGDRSHLLRVGEVP